MTLLQNIKINLSERDYHCLVASLPYLGDKPLATDLDFEAMREEIETTISRGDRDSLSLLYTFYDILNLVNLAQGAQIPHNSLGNLTPQQIEAELKREPSEEGEAFVSCLPQEIGSIVALYLREDDEIDEDSHPKITLDELENQLWEAYYRLSSDSKCRFVRLWSGVDRTLRNIIAAEKARTLGVDISQVMVGADELVEQIESSTAADYGLSGEFKYIEELMEVVSREDFLEREHLMDALRWEIASELSEKEYFSLSHIASYLVKLNILERWTRLSKEIGRERFEAIVKSFTDFQ